MFSLVAKFICFYLREERNMSQTLRQEQDRAYQLALEEDREKVGTVLK